MNKSARLADVGRTALVEKRYSKKGNKGCRDQGLSFVEVVAFANLAAERMIINRYPC
jgi:hypothetical protein